VRPCWIRVALMAAAVAGSAAGSASAQEQRVAVFGIGALVDVASGDSDYGRMAMYGGELVVTIRGTVRAGVDLEVGRIGRTDLHNVVTCEPSKCSDEWVRTPFSFRQTAITVSVFREWPRTARVRGFAGGGLGVLFQRLRGVFPDDMKPWRGNHAPVVLHARGGVVGTVSKRVCIRAEGVFSVASGISGILGARVGMGYLF
jgi:hypothetical protein